MSSDFFQVERGHALVCWAETPFGRRLNLNTDVFVVAKPHIPEGGVAGWCDGEPRVTGRHICLIGLLVTLTSSNPPPPTALS